MGKIITEKELILPSLYIMKNSEEGMITTTDLIASLTRMLKPTGKDAEILSSRKDSHFSQKVRNLKSHKTLYSQDLAEETKEGFKITSQGLMYLNENIENILYLINNDFNYDSKKSGLELISQNPKRRLIPFEEIISEGEKKQVTSTCYTRSSALRKAATEFFTKDGKLICDCCHFNFELKYSNPFKCNCIEFHHMKPLFSYEDEDNYDTTIESALKNLLPVCPNCHRVIHKCHISVEQIDEFKRSFQ